MEVLSAGDLEKFGYCPLSWWLSRENEVTNEVLQEGERRHGELADDLQKIVTQELKASRWEKMVMWSSVMATGLALLGVFSISDFKAADQSRVLGIIAILWILLAVFTLYRSASLKEKKTTAQYKQVIAFFALLAMLASLNSIPLFGLDQQLAMTYEFVALVLLASASIALYISINASAAAQAGKDNAEILGNVRYVGEGEYISRLLYSERYGLRGRPDYVVEVEDQMVPVEVKTGRTPRGPLFSHILQVAAYCLLIQESGYKVTYGILRYGEEDHEIEFDNSLKELLLGKLEEMREALRTGDVHRNHHRVGKCQTCSRREFCPEKLV